MRLRLPVPSAASWLVYWRIRKCGLISWNRWRAVTFHPNCSDMAREYSGFVSRVGGWSVWGRTHMVASGVAAEEPELCSVLGLSVDGYTACEHRWGRSRNQLHRLLSVGLILKMLRKLGRRVGTVGEVRKGVVMGVGNGVSWGLRWMIQASALILIWGKDEGLAKERWRSILLGCRYATSFLQLLLVSEDSLWISYLQCTWIWNANISLILSLVLSNVIVNCIASGKSYDIIF